MRPIFGCMIVLLAACRVAPPSLSDQDKTAIRAVTDSFVAYFHAGRDSGNASLYTENATLLPPNHGIVEGRPAILAFFQSYPALPDFVATTIDIDGRGDLAYARGTYSFSMPAAGGQPPVNDHGKFLEIRRRQADGRWLIVADMFNSDVPLPTR